MSDAIDKQIALEADVAQREREARARERDVHETALETALASIDDEPPILTERQCLFVQHYLGEARGNASLAATMAGYTGEHAKQSGHEMLSQPAVRTALREEQSARVARLRMSADQLLVEIMALGRFDITALVDPESGEVVTANQLSPEARRIVEGYKVKTSSIWGEGEQIGETREVEYRQPSRIASYSLAAKLAGYLIEKTEHTGEVVLDHAGDVRVVIVPAKAPLPDDDGNHRTLDS